MRATVEVVDEIEAWVAQSIGGTRFEAVLEGLRQIGLGATMRISVITYAVFWPMLIMEQANRLPPMYGAIVLTGGILGYLLNAFYFWLERRVIFWSPAARERAT